MLIIIAALDAQPAERPAVIDLDTLRLANAHQFDGRPVVASLTSVAPPYTWRRGREAFTVTGPPDKGDGSEWSVFLKGDRLRGIREGDRLTVRGVLRVYC